MDLPERRQLLSVNPNPDARLDYLVSLSGHMNETLVRVRYVPDRLILDPITFGRYLGALGGENWDSLERVAVTIRDDINDELVARWIQVALSAPDDIHPGMDDHGVMLEDRQPKWDNPALLSRLQSY
jgi:7-cyano-7-deazaguanine reductase